MHLLYRSVLAWFQNSVGVETGFPFCTLSGRSPKDTQLFVHSVSAPHASSTVLFLDIPIMHTPS